MQREYANAWFEHEKHTNAEDQPNADGIGRYQLDFIEHKDLYQEFRLDMRDTLQLNEIEIASYNVWLDVWHSAHRDLVIRALVPCQGFDFRGDFASSRACR